MMTPSWDNWPLDLARRCRALKKASFKSELKWVEVVLGFWHCSQSEKKRDKQKARSRYSYQATSGKSFTDKWTWKKACTKRNLSKASFCGWSAVTSEEVTSEQSVAAAHFCCISMACRGMSAEAWKSWWPRRTWRNRSAMTSCASLLKSPTQEATVDVLVCTSNKTWAGDSSMACNRATWRSLSLVLNRMLVRCSTWKIWHMSLISSTSKNPTDPVLRSWDMRTCEGTTTKDHWGTKRERREEGAERSSGALTLDLISPELSALIFGILPQTSGAYMPIKDSGNQSPHIGFSVRI